MVTLIIFEQRQLLSLQYLQVPYDLEHTVCSCRMIWSRTVRRSL